VFCIKILQIGILFECTLEQVYTHNSPFYLQLANRTKFPKTVKVIHYVGRILRVMK
jgi:hypothetical protein